MLASTTSASVAALMVVVLVGSLSVVVVNCDMEPADVRRSNSLGDLTRRHLEGSKKRHFSLADYAAGKTRPVDSTMGE